MVYVSSKRLEEGEHDSLEVGEALVSAESAADNVREVGTDDDEEEADNNKLELGICELERVVNPSAEVVFS
ncbi:unnamed protein product [Linum trigynum]|uniref:Uncharacterized protein n=1 Tax=Linum trigynum TaxID=586398 RepID=A0AAV2FN85_9ROSI